MAKRERSDGDLIGAAGPSRHPRLQRRRVVAVAIAGVAGLVLLAAAILVWHHHQQALLERTPSYRYGQSVMQYVASHGNGGVSPEQECDIALASRPGNISHYDKGKARAGCLDQWYALNE